MKRHWPSIAAALVASALLAVILVPNFIQARSRGRFPACKSNLRNISTALEMYSADFSGYYPERMALLEPDYLRAIPTCPSAGRDTYSASYVRAVRPPGATKGDAYTLMCQGANHESAGLEPDFPQYNSVEGIVERAP